MAIDPDARQTSNTAMMISIGAIVLLVLGALAYFATRNNEPNQTTVIAPGAPTTERVIEKTTEVPVVVNPGTTVNPAPPANTPAAAPKVETKTNVTINTPPANTPGTVVRPQTPAGDGAKSNTTTNVTVNASPAGNTATPASNSAGNSATPAATPKGY